ncbi:hypothetical protein NQ028_13355 [Corynebacterium phoceense]|uniref:hypothetical protein n=1 Tax=Corynebacterium phoceense TaxID=1686286 RepID=UPI00211D0304|nr:hypothetical protein [Corynebacterium phoceense]MCQ9342104.1 hypothetical protein [Corynebacterium phoceense]
MIHNDSLIDIDDFPYQVRKVIKKRRTEEQEDLFKNNKFLNSYDDYHFIDPVRGTTIDLSGGEGIIRPEAVKGMGGKGAIDAINNAAMSGGIGAVRKLLGQGASIGAYKKGGVLDDRIDRTLNEARKHHGKPYQWGWGCPQIVDT